MKNTIFAITIAFLLISCSSKEGAVDTITQLESKLYSDNQTVFDRDVADNLVTNYRDYVASYPDDEKSPLYLFKAGEVSMGMESTDNALACYRQVYTDYPDFSKAATAMFLEGFVFETQSKALVKAQKSYREFMDKYPDHTLADDAKFSLKNLGKSDEEIIREFEEKLKNKALEDSVSATTSTPEAI
ncbi:MAG: hypothetical protein COB85_07320 [Bacteroidetes bacterium]|nr:MAG: hypothetical protein COB85_07320 [Bacteroidota bacterium]